MVGIEPLISNKRVINGVTCGLQRFLFTWALVVNVTKLEGYEDDGLHEIFDFRFCFEHFEDALASINAWDGISLAPGPWIKCKGIVNGVPTDMLNPSMEG